MVINKEKIEEFEFSFSEDNELIIEDGCKSIGYKSFSVCENAEYIKLPDSIESIDEKAFFDCKKLKEIYIGKNVNYIGSGVFKGCINLEKIIISPDNEHYIVKDNCLYTKDLKTLLCYPALKNDVTFETPIETVIIDQYAFSDNTSIKTLILNTNITTLNSFAFHNCINLDTLIILGKINTNGENLYNNCKKLKNIYCFSDFKLTLLIGLEDIDKLVVSGLVDINLDDWQLDNFGILKEVKSINIINIKENDKYILENNTIYSKDKTILYRVLPNTTCEEYKCIKSIKKLYKWSFKHCTNIKNVRLNDGLEIVDIGTFENCNFEKIIFPDSVTTIEKFALTWCYNLKKVILSDSLKRMGDAIFKECKQLNNVIIPLSVEYAGKNLFEKCDNLTNIIITEKLYNSIQDIFLDSTCNPKVTFYNVG